MFICDNFVVVDGFNYLVLRSEYLLLLNVCCYLFNEFSLVKIKKY